MWDYRTGVDGVCIGFITLVVTIPVMLAMYLVIHNDTLFARGDYFWFPFLIFTSLTLFSVLTLVYYHET